ncbi:MAG: hypothetical protein EU543_01485 [Promethearchaeota archaeon]|nr:MAG: hypothetical protein EU543_01485 [Candidatus Lokiarchaeota archaeon]
MSNTTNRRRTLIERAQDIFEFMKTQDDIFPKSNLKNIGLNPRAAERWLKLIEFIQDQPKIRVIQTEHNTLIEKTEGKYQEIMKNMMLDESLPFTQRLQHANDYLKSIYVRERLTEIKNYKKKGDMKIMEDIKKIMEELGIESLEKNINLAGLVIVNESQELIYQTSNWDLPDLQSALSDIKKGEDSFKLNTLDFKIVERSSEGIIATNLNSMGHILYVPFQGGILLSYAMPQADLKKAIEFLKQYAKKLKGKI